MTIAEEWQQLRVMCWHLVAVFADEVVSLAERQIDKINGEHI